MNSINYKEPVPLNIIEDDILLQRFKEAGMYYEKDLIENEISEDLLNMVSSQVAAQYHVIPVNQEKDELLLVSDHSDALQNLGILSELLHMPVNVMLADADNIAEALNHYYGISNYSQVGSGAEITLNSKEEIESSPLNDTLDRILQRGAEMEASDIHIKRYGTAETGGGMYVWMRVNGDIIDVTRDFPISFQDAPNFVNIVKNRDTTQKAESQSSLMPNNGAFEFTRGNTLIRCRLVTVPDGMREEKSEKIDIRLMPQLRKRVSLNELYFNNEKTGTHDLAAIENILMKSAHGMFIASGPVGSGKTTSLYAQMGYLWEEANAHGHLQHVFTIEDPIEIRDMRYTQTQVRKTQDELTNLTALDLLDAALRADPCVLLFGEIRNEIEAQAAMRASQTGLKMFSTVHAADCAKTILRLLNLGVDKFSMLAEMRFIICQRLIPVLCPNCSQPHVLTDMEKMILSEAELAELTSSEGKVRELGSPEARARCTNKHCKHRGYIGRIAVPEYITFNDDIRDALLHQNDFHSVNSMLEQNDFTSMWKRGFNMVKLGNAQLYDVLMHIGKE